MKIIVDIGTEGFPHFIFFDGEYCIHGDWYGDIDLKEFTLHIRYTKETVKIKRYCLPERMYVYKRNDPDNSKFSDPKGDIVDIHHFDESVEDWILNDKIVI